MKLKTTLAAILILYAALQFGPTVQAKPLVQTQNIAVQTSKGQTVTAHLTFTWDYTYSLKVTGITFSGDQNTWVICPAPLPDILNLNNASLPLTITVPSTATPGQYIVTANIETNSSIGQSNLQADIMVSVSNVSLDTMSMDGVEHWISANLLPVVLGVLALAALAVDAIAWKRKH